MENAFTPDTCPMQGVEDVALPRGLNLCQDDVLVGRDDDRQLIALDDSPQSHLELTIQPAKRLPSARPFHCDVKASWQYHHTTHSQSDIPMLQQQHIEALRLTDKLSAAAEQQKLRKTGWSSPAILNKDAVGQAAVALLHPPQIVLELPCGQRPACSGPLLLDPAPHHASQHKVLVWRASTNDIFIPPRSHRICYVPNRWQRNRCHKPLEQQRFQDLSRAYYPSQIPKYKHMPCLAGFMGVPTHLLCHSTHATVDAACTC